MNLLKLPQRFFRDLTEGIRVALDFLMPLIGAAFVVTLMVGLFAGALYLIWTAAFLGLLLALDGFEQ